MAQRVEARREVSLNSVRYPITGNVRREAYSQYPEKQVVGPTTRNSRPRADVIEWRDWRGGIGKNRMSNVEDVNRAWYSELNINHEGHLVLPALDTTTAASGVAGVFTVGAIGELASELYVPFGTSIRKLSFGSDSWGSELKASPGTVTDTVTCRINGTVYMFFAHTTGYTRTSDGSTFEDETDDMVYMECWDERIWGIDNTGQLRWSHTETIGTDPTWTDDAQLPLPNTYVTDLFVGPDAGGEEILYAATKVGLFAHDAGNSRLVRTQLQLPFHENAGDGCEVFRLRIYYPAGLSIYEYNPMGGTLRLVGPDLDHGLPANRRGKIVHMVSSHNKMFALIDSTSTAATDLEVFDSSEFSTEVMDVLNVGVSSILSWDGRGWGVEWVSDSNTQAIDTAIVSNAYSGYRLWWGQDEQIRRIDLPVDIINPDEVDDYDYRDGTVYHETPWVDIDQADVDKLALALKAETRNCSSDETITISYATNYSTSFTSFTSITSDGVTTFPFPDSTTPTGTTFNAIRFKVGMDRGAANVNSSPDLVALTFEYRKKLEHREALGFTIDFSFKGEYAGNTAAQLRAALLAAVQSNTMVELTYRDDQSSGNPRNYYVDIITDTNLETTGYLEVGEANIMAVEP